MEPQPRQTTRIALILDPRFPGGTSAAVAQEIGALDAVASLRVFALETAMFAGRKVNPVLQAVLDARGIELVWNPPVVRSDVVVFHNPACLKFDRQLDLRISCRLAFVVTHENFLRPNGAEGFDVDGCLRQLDAALVAGARFLAPVSAHNRRGVAAWAAGRGWTVADFDWPNVCDFKSKPPSAAPRDRRGRHSRAGFEKFPPMETMLAHFPAHAESCAILGGDMFLLDPETVPPHWRVLRFGEVEVASFLEELDFFVYFTHPQWRESFGRAIAEAIAAGKLVITDPGTAEAFGEAVVASDGDDVDAIVRDFLHEPPRYRDFVIAAQGLMERFRPEAVADHLLRNIERCEGAGNAAL